jgi:CMP-N,N'-diacetyllegionaminic acid synthase
MGTNVTPRILGITLARGGSKGVHKKNIRPICGKPMLAYTIEEGLKSKYITRFVLSTDDEEIASVGRDYGIEVPFMRPAELATDTASSKSCLQHATAFMENLEGQPYDYIVELMVTNPLKTVEDIDAALNKLIETGADSVIGVMKLEDHHPLRIKKIVDDRIVDFCLPEPNEARRQDLKPDAYIRNGSIYSVRRDELMVNNRRYGTENSRPYIFPPERTVNVDTLADFYLAEYQMNLCQNKNQA